MNHFPSTLRLVCLACFGSMVSMRVCDPMLIELGREFSVSTGHASRVVAAYAIAYGLAQLVYGPLGDHLGKLRVVVFASMGCALLSALTSLAPTLDLLVLARAAMGAAAAGIVPLSIAWIGDRVPYEQRQETLGKLTAATLSGMIVGQSLGGLAADTLGWRTAFVLMTLIFVVAATLLHRHTRTHPRAESSASFSLRSYLRNTARLLALPGVRWVLAATVMEGVLAYGTLAFVPSQLMQAFSFSSAGAGAVMVLFGIGGLLYSLQARRWVALLGERGLALTGATLFGTGLLILAWAPAPWLAVLACFFAGLGLYMLHGTLQTLATQMAPESRGTAVTLFACTLFLSQSVGVPLFGATLDAGQLALSYTLAWLGLLALGAWLARQINARTAAAGASPPND